MKPRDQAVAELNAENYCFRRHGANHDIYYNEELGRMISLKRHDFDEDDLRYIRKEIRQNKQRLE